MLRPPNHQIRKLFFYPFLVDVGASALNIENQCERAISHVRRRDEMEKHSKDAEQHASSFRS